MKELSKSGVFGVNAAREDIIKEVSKHILFAVCGFLSARVNIMGGIMPFCPAIIGGAGRVFSASAAAGAVIGYLVFGKAPAFRYVVIAVSIAAIKLLSRTALKTELRPAFCALITALVTVSTDIVVVKNDIMDIVLAVTETVVAAAVAYFIATAFSALSKMDVGLTPEELSALLISGAAAMSGFFFIKAGEISVGIILSGVVIMLTSRFCSVGLSAVCGIAFGITAYLCTLDAATFAVLCFCGLIAGAFSKLGKYGITVSFLIAAFAGQSVAKSENPVAFILDALLAAAVFLLIPKTAAIKFGKLISVRPQTDTPTGIKKSVTMRLNFAAAALLDVSETIEQVAGELTKINSPEFSDVLEDTENDVCKGCTLRIHCWETKRNETVAAVIEMTKAVKCGEPNPESFVNESFAGGCLRLGALGKAVYKNFSEYAASLSAERRIDEIRGATVDQFYGMSNMLTDLCGEIENQEKYDNAAAQNIVAGLKNVDIIADACCCRIDKYGRMNVEIRVARGVGGVINRMQIMRQVSLVCDRDFDAPVLSSLKNETLINLNEKAPLCADIGVRQICHSQKAICGDAYRYFLDGKGRAVMVLSDGMGTGGRAAVDSAMASGLMSRLIRAGFGYDCSLNILNSSMIFKSTDESLATVDIAVIDLFTGKTDLFKAGAAPTLVRRSGRTGKAQSSSLAAGILRDIAFDKATFRLRRGDILLMVSDGAITEGTEWICAELENWVDGSAQELAEHIAAAAARRRTDAHEDDITVMAVIIEKAA